MSEEVGDGLTPAQAVGVAWAHIDKAYKLLKAAAEADAVIVERDQLQACANVVDAARTTVSWDSLTADEKLWRGALDEVHDLLVRILE